jgi:hypothetical protein
MTTITPTAGDASTAEVTSWPGVERARERGEFGFRVGRRRDRPPARRPVLHIASPRTSARAPRRRRLDYHPVFPGKPGFGSRALATDEDVAGRDRADSGQLRTGRWSGTGCRPRRTADPPVPQLDRHAVLIVTPLKSPGRLPMMGVSSHAPPSPTNPLRLWTRLQPGNSTPPLQRNARPQAGVSPLSASTAAAPVAARGVAVGGSTPLVQKARPTDVSPPGRSDTHHRQHEQHRQHTDQHERASRPPSGMGRGRVRLGRAGDRDR